MQIALTVKEKRFVEAMEAMAGSVGKLSAELNYKLAKSLKEADAISRQFAQGFGKVGDKMQSFGQNMSIYVTAPLTLMAGAALNAYGELDSLERSLLTVEGTSQNLEKRLVQLREAAKLPGLGFQEAIKGDVALRSVGIAAETSLKILKEFGNANAMGGGGKEQLSSIITQLSQMSAKGKVLSEDLKPIITAAPTVAKALKEMFGTVDSGDIQKKLASSGKNSQDFIEMLLTTLEKAPRVTGGFKNAMENVKDSLFVFAANMGKALDKAFDFEGIVNSISAALNSVQTWFSSLAPEMQKAIFVFGGLVAVAGPLITAFGFIVSSVIPAFLTGLGTITAPILAIGAVVAVVAANIIKYWDNIKNVLVNTGIWSGASEVFKAGLSLLGDIVGVFISLFTDDWEGLWVNMKNIMKRVWNGIVEVFTFPLKTILQLQQSVFSSLGFDKMANGFGYALGVVNQLTNKIKADIPESTNNLKKLADAFAGLGGGKTTTGGVTVNNGDALKALEKQRDILGKLNVNTIVSADVKGIDKLMNPEQYTKKTSWADEMLAAGKKLATELPKILDSGQLQAAFDKLDFKTQLVDKMKLAVESASKIDLSNITAFPVLLAHEFMYAMPMAGQKIEESIRKNVTDRAKLALIDFNKTATSMLKSFGASDIPNALAGMFESIGGGQGLAAGLGNAFKGILQAIGGYMIELGKKALIASQLIQTLKLSFGTVAGVPAAIALIAGGGLLKGLAGSLFSQTPKFAQGGMVTGPTFAMMGDNASGREMALPWEKTGVFAQAIAANMGGGGGGGVQIVDIQLKGEVIHAAVQMYKKNNGL